MRKFIAPLVLGALAVAVALPAGAHTRHTHHGKARCGQTHGGWESSSTAASAASSAGATPAARP
jgi:hypothetical protein